MKILIAYSSAGTGHKKIAEAVFGEFSTRIKETKILDALDHTNCFFKFIYSQGYYFLSIYLQKLWRFFFYFCDNRFFSLPIDLIRSSINRLNSKKFCAFLEREKPDIIISTHFFVNEVVNFLKKKRIVKSYLVSIITDFYAHRFWIKENVDLYVVAIKETKEELIKKGISEEKIRVLGIPVKEEFHTPQDRGFICQKLGLREDMFTVLIVTGTKGFGSIEEITDYLQDEIQIICVCGTNRKLYRRLRNKRYEFTKVYGLVENMFELMSVPDLIITKPGGSTISEALVKYLPMIFISIIPGQEEKNAKFMEDLGIGLIPKDIRNLKRIIFYLKENKDELSKIKERFKEIPKFNLKLFSDEICKSNYSHSC